MMHPARIADLWLATPPDASLPRWIQCRTIRSLSARDYAVAVPAAIGFRPAEPHLQFDSVVECKMSSDRFPQESLMMPSLRLKPTENPQSAGCHHYHVVPPYR